MPLQGEYAPSTSDWAREQAELIEASGGAEGTELHGKPVIVLTSLGAKSGKLRKTALMRVEHEGRYAAIGSRGGSPTNPAWVANLRAHPLVELQDGPVTRDYTVTEASGELRDEWWQRAVEAFPNYADYQERTERLIPVFVLEPRDA
ncbi:MAG: nitroreductase family deazaflavin-dependent oxidoreductase [Cryobacterium sp.]|nr:nitroreductase family deazaflavin-dependent oxidoreductase [Cryobacterium sp.]